MSSSHPEEVEIAASIVCAVDGSDGSARAVEVAASVSAALGLRLVLAHVAEGIASTGEEAESVSARLAREGARRLVDQVALDHGLERRAARRADVGARAETLAGIAAEEDAVLLVVGARKAGLFRASLRSGLVDELSPVAPCPVVVAPPERLAAVATSSSAVR